MPRGASPKRERQYRRIKESAKRSGRYGGRAEEVAARTVNKIRREKGETKAQRGSSSRRGRSSSTSSKRSTSAARGRRTTARKTSASRRTTGRRRTSSARRSSVSGSGRRGFASMSESRQRAIARQGGQAAHREGTAHEFSTNEARQAGRKGGKAVSRNRAHMAEIGRKGGEH